MKKLCHLDFHRGLKAHNMDAMPHTWETIDHEHCTLRVEDVALGGTLVSLEDEIEPLFHFDVALGGLGRHPPTLDIILEARV